MKRRDFVLTSASLAAGFALPRLGHAAVPCPPPSFGALGGDTVSTACGNPAGITRYSTDFPTVENPISEGGRWINGGADGLDWQNVRTNSGHAFGNSTSSAYDDCIAHLANHSIPVDHQVSVTIFRESGYTPPSSHEVEILLRFSIEPHVARGYEILVPFGGRGGQIVRWNGAMGNFTVLSTSGPGFGSVVTGDVVRAVIIGQAITVYHNDAQVLSATDSTWSTGNPGMGFFIRPGSGANPPSWCISNWAAAAAL